MVSETFVEHVSTKIENIAKEGLIESLPIPWSVGDDDPVMTDWLLPTFCFVFWYTEIRNQLVEQFKCLEQQSESRIQLLQDLQDFFRRKAEIQLEYSRSLEKLAERFSNKIRSSREHHQFKWVSLPCGDETTTPLKTT